MSFDFNSNQLVIKSNLNCFVQPLFVELSINNNTIVILLQIAKRLCIRTTLLLKNFMTNIFPFGLNFKIKKFSDFPQPEHKIIKHFFFYFLQFIKFS